MGTKTFRAAISASYNYGVASDNYGFYAKGNVPGVNKKSLKKIAAQIKKYKTLDKDLMYIVSPHVITSYSIHYTKLYECFLYIKT